MSERTVLQTMSGAIFSICATLPESYDAAGYQSTDLVFSEVGEIENYGEYGVTANVSNFTAVKTAIVQKFKGAKDYGTMSMTLGNMPSDAGQDIVEAAVESQNRYSVKIEYPLASGEVTKETHFLDVLVTKRTFMNGAVDDVRKLSVDMAVCRQPVIVAAT